MNDLGRVLDIERHGNLFRVRLEEAFIELSFLSRHLLRVRALFPESGSVPSQSVVTAAPVTDLTLSVDDGSPYVVRSSELVVQIHREPFRLAIYDPAGSLLSQGWAEGLLASQVVDGGRRRVQARFARATEEHFYGLGQGGGAGIDRDGTTRHLWNSHCGWGPGTDLAVPLLLSSRGYGLFFDNPWDSELQIGRMDGRNTVVFTAEGGSLDWYFLYGPDPKRLLGEYAGLTGHSPMPPRWSLGYMQSTRHFENPEEVIDVGRQLRARQIPCDTIIFLSTYGEDKGINAGVGTLDLQPELFADPEAVLGALHSDHFHYVFHEYPVVRPKSPLFAEAQEQGHLVEPFPTGETTMWREGQRMLDFSRAETREWWWNRHEPLVGHGFDGWWLDGGEGPAASAQLAGGSGQGLHNVYDLYRQQAFFEGERRSRPDRRSFMLCRSGYAGMQRYGSASWSGDIGNTFDVFAAQLPLGLSTALSGIPYWGTDIGGFFHTVPESPELYARWFQFGVFCPIFRSHGHGQYLRGWREHTPWAHGPEVEAICRKYAELRQRLLPYNYSLAWEAHRDGTPLMRPLLLEFPADRNVVDMSGEYLWGPSLLVAPVTRGAARHWPVYLPNGSWLDYWTGTVLAGGRWVEVEAPLERIPLFVRGGAIVPLGPAKQYDAEVPLDNTLTLLIFPEGESTFTLYEDDGETLAYERGEYALTTIRCSTDGGSIRLTIDAPTGDYRGKPSSRRIEGKLRLPTPPSTVSLGTRRLARFGAGDQLAPDGAGWWWSDGFVHVVTTQRATAVEIVLQP